MLFRKAGSRSGTKLTLNLYIMETIKFFAIGLFITSNLAFYTGVAVLLFKSAKGLK